MEIFSKDRVDGVQALPGGQGMSRQRLHPEDDEREEDF